MDQINEQNPQEKVENGGPRFDYIGMVILFFIVAWGYSAYQISKMQDRIDKLEWNMYQVEKSIGPLPPSP